MFTTSSSNNNQQAPQHTFPRIFYPGGIRVAFLIFLQISEKCNLPSDPAPLYQTLGDFMQYCLQSSDVKDIEDFEWGLEELGPAEDCYENSKHSLQTV